MLSINWTDDPIESFDVGYNNDMEGDGGLSTCPKDGSFRYLFKVEGSTFYSRIIFILFQGVIEVFNCPRKLFQNACYLRPLLVHLPNYEMLISVVPHNYWGKLPRKYQHLVPREFLSKKATLRSGFVCLDTWWIKETEGGEHNVLPPLKGLVWQDT